MCFSGRIVPQTVIDFIDQVVQDPQYNKNHFTIIDLRSTELHYDVDGLRRVLKYIEKKEGFAGKRKTVYITSNPNHVVPPLLMSSKEYEIPMEIKVVSSAKSAIDHLKIPGFTVFDYNKIIKTLCNCHN